MLIITLSKWWSVCQLICSRIVEILVLSVALMLAILFNANVHQVFKELLAKHQWQVSHVKIYPSKYKILSTGVCTNNYCLNGAT